MLPHLIWYGEFLLHALSHLYSACLSGERKVPLVEVFLLLYPDSLEDQRMQFADCIVQELMREYLFLDSFMKPPYSMLGLDAEKKKKDLALMQ